MNVAKTNKNNFSIQLLLLIIMVTAACDFGFDFNLCNTSSLSEPISSPDNRYIVWVFERNCGATTPFIRMVYILPAGSKFDPDHTDNQVFSIWGQPEIKAVWRSDRELNITYSYGKEPREKYKWRDVKITYD